MYVCVYVCMCEVCVRMYSTNHSKVAKSYRLHGMFSEYRPSKRTVFLAYRIHGTVENMAEFN